MSARIASGEEGITEAAAALVAGGVVALPTETVYGLAGRALESRALAEIFAVKARPLSDPLIVHVPDPAWLDRIAAPGVLARRLAEAFWPGPLTLVVPKKPCVPDLCTAGEPTVAIRMSAHPLFSAVLVRLGEPVAAPSANRFGRISPTTARHVLEELGDKISIILDGGPCVHGIESTIVHIREEVIHVLRQGPIPSSALAKFGQVSRVATGAAAPGMLKSHYAPRTPMQWADSKATVGGRVGLLAWREARPGFAAVEILTPSGNPAMAAANLYAAMRRLDALDLDLILAERPPPSDLGDAILERLRKAMAPRL